MEQLCGEESLETLVTLTLVNDGTPRSSRSVNPNPPPNFNFLFYRKPNNSDKRSNTLTRQ